MRNFLHCVRIVISLTIFLAACAPGVRGIGEGLAPPNQGALTAAVTLPAPTTAPETHDSLLPRSLYYLSKDSAGLMQVFRLARDGITRTQITSEPVDVEGYDVSQADRSVAYVAGNQLLLVNADGSNRRLLAAADPDDAAREIQGPAFAPDGQTLAYGDHGLNLYDLSTGVSRLVIENQYGEPLPNGLPFPIEIYWPDRFSPDGTKLLLAVGRWENAPSSAVYDLGRQALVRYVEGEEYLYCCSFFGGAEWAPDGSGYFGIASAHDYAFAQGALWKVDAATGTVATLIPATESDGTLNLPYKPSLGPDGQLYYFFLNYPEPSGGYIVARPPLQLVRSAPDGVSGRTVLHAGTFALMNEALWAPDASFVIVALAPNPDTYAGGQAELVYFDGRPSVVLAPFAQLMSWGP